MELAWDLTEYGRRLGRQFQFAGEEPFVDAYPASGLFFAVNKNPYGEVEERYARLLGPTIYRHQRRAEGYGLKIWCADALETRRVIGLADDRPLV